MPMMPHLSRRFIIEGFSAAFAVFRELFRDFVPFEPALSFVLFFVDFASLAT
jgi:hypothetical protein